MESDRRTVHVNVKERRARERRVWRRALVFSAVIHLLILAFGPGGSVFVPMEASAGPDQGDDTATDGLISVVALSSAPPIPLTPPPVPMVDVAVPIPVPVTADPTPEIPIEPTVLEDPGVGSTTGQDPGDVPDAGVPGAAGDGDAGDADSGRNRLIPPSPRGMIIPPTNGNVRGSEIEIWVFVDERGRVVADSTRLQPPTRDGGFNDRLRREASEWIFEPARENGDPVAAWFPYRITME